MNRVLIAILLIAATAVAALPAGSWVFSSGAFGPGPDQTTASLVYDSTLRLKIESTESGEAFFKLATTFPKPTNSSYKIEFLARVDAPGINLDYDKDFGAGEKENNDGPNLFALAYDWNGSAPDNLPFDMNSLSFYDRKDSMCHQHFECNWMGEPENYYGFYCTSASTAAGWVYDAKTYGAYVKVNDYDAEAFPDSDWKTIRLNMDAGECNVNSSVITLLIMGVDTLAGKYYTWEIKDVKLVAGTTTPLPLNQVYQVKNGEYVRIAKPAYCGDGEVEGIEQCDGNTNVTEGWTCTTSCQLRPVCGDNKMVGDEVCDGLKHRAGYTCASNCSAEINVCGDNIIVNEEVCDGNSTTAGFRCSGDCKSMTTVCGDGIVVGAEQCDKATGTDAQHGCTPNCTLYRLLTEDEQAGVDSLMALIDEAEPGVPSTAKLTIPAGTYTAKDIVDQFMLGNRSIGGNVSFCAVGVTACEERYVFIADAMATEAGIAPVDQLNGIAKVYEVAANGTSSYYIGFRGTVGWMPYIEMDTTMWIVVGLIVFLLLGAGVVLLLIVGGYMYMTKGGISFGQKKKM